MRVSVLSLYHHFIIGMTVISLPRPIRPCREYREEFVRNRLVFLWAQWYLPVPSSLNHNCRTHVVHTDSDVDHYRSDYAWVIASLTGPPIGVWTDRKGEWFWPSPFEDEHRRTFAVFTLIPSLLKEYSPNTEHLYSPSIPHGTHTSCGWVWAASVRCAECEVGGRDSEGLKYLPLDVWSHSLQLQLRINELMRSAGGIQKDLTSGKDIHGHRTSKAPHPVRSAQLTGVPPS